MPLDNITLQRRPSHREITWEGETYSPGQSSTTSDAQLEPNDVVTINDEFQVILVTVQNVVGDKITGEVKSFPYYDIETYKGLSKGENITFDESCIFRASKHDLP